jgi:transposase
MFEGQVSPPDVSGRGENMLAPDEVAAMVRLTSLGWGTRKVAAALGCSRTTVKRYVEAGGIVPYRQPRRGRRLDGLDDWLAERFRQHRGNAEVVRQDLAREPGILVSLRTVERRVAPLRQALRAERAPACSSRRRRASSCRLTSARPECRSAASRFGSICS